MAIVFQCQHCGKKIEAPEKLAGKRGKCPKCRQSLEIPPIDIDDDAPLTLKPLDAEEEQMRQQLMSETYNITQNLLNERAVPEETPAETYEPSDPSDISYMLSTTPMDTNELKKNILTYFQLMASGDLDQASQYEQLILPHGEDAVSILDSIALNDLPEPELAQIPPHVLSGLIRSLRTQINS